MSERLNNLLSLSIINRWAERTRFIWSFSILCVCTDISATVDCPLHIYYCQPIEKVAKIERWMYFTIFIRQMVDLVFVVASLFLSFAPHRIHCCLCEKIKFTFVGVICVSVKCTLRPLFTTPLTDSVKCESKWDFTCIQWSCTCVCWCACAVLNGRWRSYTWKCTIFDFIYAHSHIVCVEKLDFGQRRRI